MILPDEYRRTSSTMTEGYRPAHASTSTADARFLAHDTRNWLTVLRVYCDLLRSSGAVVEGYQPWMDELSGAVDRGQVLVTSLLDTVERAEGAEERDLQPPQEATRDFPNADGAAAAETVVLDVVDAIARRLPLIRRMAGSGIEVELDAPATYGGQVAMPENDFERILHNLISNAIEAMPNGGRLRIALRTGQRNLSGPANDPKGTVRRTIELRIEDTGVGIAPDALAHVFEPGVSSKGVGNRESERHGFGLAIVRQLTEGAGGTVQVRSHPGRGTCFAIELPQRMPETFSQV